MLKNVAQAKEARNKFKNLRLEIKRADDDSRDSKIASAIPQIVALSSPNSNESPECK